MARDKSRLVLREQPLSRLFPNMITLASLCCGLSAIRYALDARWELSVGFILVSALLDGMDGRIARMLGASSNFGAQLDSLADFVCFGVAPAMVMYLWQLHDVRGIGWAVMLFYACCCALRLARFNTGLSEEPQAAWKKQFFTGVPSPAGGIMCLLPLIFFLQMEHQAAPPVVYSLFHVLLIGVLMASRIPTFAAKNLRIKHELVLPVMLGAALMVVVFIIEPWLFILLISAAYIGSIGLSLRHYRALQAGDAAVLPAAPFGE